MNRMNSPHTILAALSLLVLCGRTYGQASLATLGQPVVIDLQTTVAGVNNGLFEAVAPFGSSTPETGQLDSRAWAYFADGSAAAAAQSPAVFGDELGNGVGFSLMGSLATGINATDVNGARALGIQPTGGHFTSGSITLRLQNNTGNVLEQIALSYDAGWFNDMERSNAFRLFWSASNTQDSYVAVPAAELISPATAENPAFVFSTTINVVLNGFSVPAGGFLHLRWVGDDISGSGQRDEFFLTNIRITGQVPTGPVLSTSVSNLPAFAQDLGTPSVMQVFTVNGSGLSDDVLVTVGSPFQVSINASFGYGSSIDLSPNGGVLNAVPVYVRLNSDQPGAYTGTVALATAGASAAVNVSGTTSAGTLPTLFLNELQALNAGSPVDEFGEADDWFEIYNPTGAPVNLAGWYVSDDPAQLTKYRFDPAGNQAVVPAGGWLLVWADNQTTQGDLHTNFALSSTSGESVLLVGPDGVTMVDQISFGPQASGVSFGRATDGGTPWVQFDVPTPGASNNATGIATLQGPRPLCAWPNPVAAGHLFLDRIVTAVVLDMSGRLVAQVSRSAMVDVTALGSGSYLIRTEDGAVLRFVKQ